MHLSRAIEDYLRMRQSRVHAHTYRCEEGELHRFLNDVGNLPVRDLTVEHIEDWFYGPTGRNTQVSEGTFNNSRARLVGFCRWMQGESLVQQDLMRRVTRRKVFERERVRLNPGQMVEAIEGCVHPRDRVAVAIAINTGIRVSSVSQLRVSDIDLEAGAIRYINVKLRRERSLPITADLDRELRAWLGYYEAQCGPLNKTWYLVPARPRGGVRGGCELVPSKAFDPRRIAHTALEAVGMDGKGEGFHSFRRSAGRAVYETALANGDPRAIHIAQAFLDHTDSSMTQKYIGTNHERQKLDTYLKGKSFMPAPAVEHDNVVVAVDFKRRRSG